VLTALESVSGPVAIDQLGVVMPHEHTFIDLLLEYRGDGLINDPELVRDELVGYREAGGTTIVDCTSRGLRPQPLLNRRVAAESGVIVIMGTGFYRRPYLDEDWLASSTADEVAEVIIRDATQGIDGTDVRAGVIGEVGCDREITPPEEKSFRAAARAHHATGLSITTHAARWPVGLAQLDVLEQEGVPPERVIIGHCGLVPDRGYHRALAERGAWVQFDTIQPGNPYFLERDLKSIHALVEAGHADRVLLSHDVCLVSHMAACGGFGYSYILREFLGRLEATGLPAGMVRDFVTRNPAHALSGADA
jgi:predicted metal-dependent phosphotriesterase family hydrolase